MNFRANLRKTNPLGPQAVEHESPERSGAGTSPLPLTITSALKLWRAEATATGRGEEKEVF